MKEEVKNKIIDRVCARLGEGFRKAIRYSLAATPLTFERYTYNERGSFMGWRASTTNGSQAFFLLFLEFHNGFKDHLGGKAFLWRLRGSLG